MKRINTLIILVLLLSLSALAQGLSIGPELGYFKAQDADGSVLFGGQARISLSNLISIEGAIDYRSEDYSNGMVKVTSYPIMATVLIYPVPIVYGAVGAGWYNTNYKVEYPVSDGLSSYEETTSEFGYHFGGGVELPLSKNLSLAGDIRYVFLNYDFKLIPGKEIDANFFVIKAALLFKL